MRLTGILAFTFIVLACSSGNDTGTGYHASDGVDFPCDSCPNGCTGAAQAVVAHCGCAP